MKQRLKRIGNKMGMTVVIAAAMFVVMDIAFPVKPDIEYGQLIRAEDGTVLHAFLTSDEQWRMKANLNEITPELKKAIVYKEDKYFYYHPGINVRPFLELCLIMSSSKKRTSGASTITMQVARMLAPKRRTYFNKVIEMFRAFQLELHYTKDEVLQMYLNLVPYGSNIQGVKAAAILYFNKLPEQLSLSEITALSIIPNRPTTMVLGKNNDRIVKDRNKWLMRFNKDGVFPESNIVDAINEPLNAVRFDAPKAVPQFARRMHTQYPGQPEVYTTIDKRVQSEAEEIVNEYMMALRLKNIHNCAVLIIDNKTREVKTYIGSPDFFDNEHNGQVDGVASPRSPGSTLKPILYAVCADKGIVTPKTIIADVPINMDGYMPENYDLTFRGNVTAEDALKNSLNIPAVKLINETGTDMFIKTLSLGGVSSIWNNRRSFGLSLILGGCTIRLDELTGMYASLANDGVYEPLRWTTDTAKHTGLSRKPVRLFSSSAAYMITSIISDLYRPDLPNLFDNAKDIPKVAWKTGTSYGRKDAWSIGYNKNYTIGVWVGNFDGTGVPELNGAGIATPLLFRIFNTVYKERSQDWLVQPENVGFRYVCKETGRIPEVYCTETVMDYFIPGVSDNRHCDHLKKVCLSPKEDVSYCTNCMPRSGYKVKTYPNISAELTAFYEQQHIPYTKVPEHNPLCSRVFEGVAPYITSLTNNSTYIITDKGKQQLQLQCTAANDVKTVYWYINDKFYKSTAVGERTLFCPETPNVKISCADDKGRNVDIRINVEFI